MTKFLYVITIAAFLVVGGVSSAQAHCGKCGTESHGEMKPCEKCLKKGHDKMHVNGSEPCKVCAESEIEKATSATTLIETSNDVMIKDKSNIGSLYLQSGGTDSSRYND